MPPLVSLAKHINTKTHNEIAAGAIGEQGEGEELQQETMNSSLLELLQEGPQQGAPDSSQITAGQQESAVHSKDAAASSAMLSPSPTLSGSTSGSVKHANSLAPTKVQQDTWSILLNAHYSLLAMTEQMNTLSCEQQDQEVQNMLPQVKMMQMQMQMYKFNMRMMDMAEEHGA
jgi:hypothetical protein